MLTKTKVLASNYIIRDGYGDFPDNTGDWTVLVRFNYPATTAGYMEILSLFAGAADFSDPYLFIGSQPGNSDVVVEIFDGSTDTVSTAVAIVNGTQNWVAVTYNATTHIQTLIVNGVSIGTLNFNLSAIVWDKLTLLGDASGGGNTEALSVAYCRAWSNIKSIADLTIEAASITAVSTTGLIWDCPLQTSIDLTSHNNTLNQLVGVGTITTDTTDPLLSVVAGPPSNIDPANATLITVDSAYFQDTLTAGAATTVWFKFVAGANTKMHGAATFGDLTTYKPDTTIYDGLANANANVPLIGATDDNAPLQAITTIGNTYYIKANRNGAVTPATVIVSVLEGINLPIPANSFAINDDEEDLPVILIRDGYPANVVPNIVSGEAGDILTNGFLCLADAHNSRIAIYNSIYGLIGYLAYSASGESFGFIRSHLDTAKWYIGDFGTGDIKTVNQDATFGGTTYTTGITALRCIAVNTGETIAYCSDDNANLVKKWDLNSNTLIGTFVAYIATFIATDIIVLSNDNVLICWTKLGTTKVVQYTLAGAVVRTDDYTSLNTPASTVSRMFRGVEANQSYGLLNHITGGVNVFLEVSLVDGSIIRTENIIEYEAGEFQGTTTDTPIRFGSSFSCVPWMTRTLGFPAVVANSGLYTVSGTGAIDPAKVISGEGTGAALIRHDQNWIDTSLGTSENVKIPDPYYDTFLAGDE